MRQESMRSRDTAERTVRDIRRKTHKQYSAEEKIRIVVSGLRGEDSIAEPCRREGIAESLYYSVPRRRFPLRSMPHVSRISTAGAVWVSHLTHR